jgi:hypothetical protein
MLLDLSLQNEALYSGLDIQREAGKLNLRTAPEAAIARMIANLEKIPIDSEEMILTGGMAIWAYLAVFHFRRRQSRARGGARGMNASSVYAISHRAPPASFRASAFSA